MRFVAALVLTTLFAVAAQAQSAVGYQHFTIADPQGPPIEIGVCYPTDAEPKPARTVSAAQPSRPVAE